MPSAAKYTAVAEIVDEFTSSSAAVITEYRGLTVKQLSELRRALGGETSYAVVKNTLTRRAAQDAGVTIADELLVGPTAIAFVRGDPVLAAKGLRDFARANPLLVIKGGVMDGKTLSAAEVARIADLESREVLLAKFAGALKALPTRAAGLFQAPLSQMARLLAALEDKKPAADAPAVAAVEPDTALEAKAAPEAEPEAPEVTASGDTEDATEAASVEATTEATVEATAEGTSAEDAPPAASDEAPAE
jgi:large subunit ribosomal protein L10